MPGAPAPLEWSKKMRSFPIPRGEGLSWLNWLGGRVRRSGGVEGLRGLRKVPMGLRGLLENGLRGAGEVVG